MNYRRKKRALTLLEIMIVIALITMITAVIGYSMKGSLDKGKAFRTKQAQTQLEDMLELALSEGESIDTILARPEEILKKLNLAKNPDHLLKDGWNERFDIRATRNRRGFIVRSERLKTYEDAHRLGSTQPSDDGNEE